MWCLWACCWFKALRNVACKSLYFWRRRLLDRRPIWHTCFVGFTSWRRRLNHWACRWRKALQDVCQSLDLGNNQLVFGIRWDLWTSGWLKSLRNITRKSLYFWSRRLLERWLIWNTRFVCFKRWSRFVNLGACWRFKTLCYIASKSLYFWRCFLLYRRLIWHTCFVGFIRWRRSAKLRLKTLCDVACK